jgi:hypothetical protein
MLLDDDDVEAIARRVAEIVHPEPVTDLVTVDQVCAHFGVKRSWVYAHADELGVVRLGDGPRARLRFDLRRCSERFAERETSKPAADSSEARRRRRRRESIALPPGIELIEGRSART